MEFKQSVKDTKTQSAIVTNQNDEKKFDNIEYRKQFITNLLQGKKLVPMVNFDDCDTEAVENSKNLSDVRDVMHKNFIDFNRIILEIGGKLLYIKSGTTGHTFKGISQINPNDDKDVINYAVKVVAFPKRENYGDLHDIKRPENAELMMLRVLSYFVVNGQTPHIILPIGTFNTSIKPFIDLAHDKVVDNKKYDQFYKKWQQDEYHNEVSILISEWANGGDLLDYIRSNYKKMSVKDWRILFFQLISVLAIIHKKYPTFRHNDLKANNILIQKIDNRKKNNIYRYQINNNNYFVPNIGIQIKIWDFDFACIPGIVENSKVSAEWTNKINIKPVRNQYYDIHYFFNTFTKKGFFPEFWEDPCINYKVKEFVKRIIPEHLTSKDTVTERGRILENIEYTTPTRILIEDDFFDKLREKK
jgi:serine/threonine protein kinase